MSRLFTLILLLLCFEGFEQGNSSVKNVGIYIFIIIIKRTLNKRGRLQGRGGVGYFKLE